MRYPALFVTAGLVAPAVTAQALYDWTADPLQSVASAATAEAREPDLARTVAVDIDLLRSGPGLLAFPLPDGEPLWVVRTHFEDRGEGNVLWRGRVADGPLSDSVMLTLQDGHLVGRFGELGGPLLSLAASPDGRGRVVRRGSGAAGVPLCSVAAPPMRDGPARAASAARAGSAPVVGADTDRANA